MQLVGSLRAVRDLHDQGAVLEDEAARVVHHTAQRVWLVVVALAVRDGLKILEDGLLYRGVVRLLNALERELLWRWGISLTLGDRDPLLERQWGASHLLSELGPPDWTVP